MLQILTTDAPARAVSFLSYEDNAAYYDWTGLRFLTEMEFEKAAKGPIHILDMVASGGVTVFDELYTLSNDGMENADITNPGENITNMCYMELSGNLYERCIGVGTPINRAYTGAHGNGEVLSSGNHNVANWPAVGSEGAIAYRGGSWANSSSLCAVADRNSAAVLSSITNSRIGARGARTAN